MAEERLQSGDFWFLAGWEELLGAASLPNGSGRRRHKAQVVICT